MLGLMQQRPLLISTLVDYAAGQHGAREIVSRDPAGAIHRSTYAEVATRAKRIAGALDALGLEPGDRVATLAWNGHRHLELYYGVASSGRVLHTVNPRLFPEQLQYIIHHAEDAYVFFDPVFAPLIEELAPRLPHVLGWVSLSDRAGAPEVKVDELLVYEELIAAASPEYEWPVLDENAAATLCYTSGTTGNPKGVLYSHRSTVLHAFAACAVDGLGLSGRELVPRRRAALSRQRLERSVLRGDVRDEAGAAGAAARSGKPLYADDRRGLHQVGRRADGVAELPHLDRGEPRPPRPHASSS